MSGTISLVGPSTSPGAPLITAQAINDAVNAALGTLAPKASPTFTGTLGGAAFNFTGNGTVGGTLGVTGTTALTGALTGSTGTFSGAASAASLQSTGLGTVTAGSTASQNGIRLNPFAPGTDPSITALGPAGPIGIRIVPQSGGFISLNGATSLNFTKALALTDTSANASTVGLFGRSTFSGTSGVNGILDLNNWRITDSVDHSISPQITNGFTLEHDFTGAKGGRNAFNVLLLQTGANTDTGVDNFYGAATFYDYARFTHPGATAAAPLGSFIGLNSNTQAQNGFTPQNLKSVVSYEADVGISAGSTAWQRTGIQIANLNDGQGYGLDAGLWLYSSSPTTGLGRFKTGILFGGTQQWPIDTNGTIIGISVGNLDLPMPTFQAPAKWGLDFDAGAFPNTGNPYDGGFLRARNSSWDGNGRVQLGSAYLTPSSAGLAVDAKGSFTTAAAISGAGTGYRSGVRYFTSAYGGVWSVQISGGGSATGAVTQISPAQFSSTTPPANPVAIIDMGAEPQDVATPGTGLSFNLTWNTTATALALQPSGGATTVGGTLAVTGTLSGAGVTTLLAPYALLASPSLTGAPLSTTAAVDTNTTQIATTAFVLGQAASATPLIDGTATVGTSTRFARADHIHPTDTSRAGLATNPIFTSTVNIGTGTTAQTLVVNGPAGSNRLFNFFTAGTLRWFTGVNNTAEGGANAGSDYVFLARDDAGAALSTPITLTRSTGLITFGAGGLKFNAASIAANGVVATTMTSLGPTGSHTTIQEWLTIQTSSGTTRYIPLY